MRRLFIDSPSTRGCDREKCRRQTPDELAAIEYSRQPFTIEEGDKQQPDLKLVPDDKPI
jgi:hypothetical protein